MKQTHLPLTSYSGTILKSISEEVKKVVVFHITSHLIIHVTSQTLCKYIMIGIRKLIIPPQRALTTVGVFRFDLISPLRPRSLIPRMVIWDVSTQGTCQMTTGESTICHAETPSQCSLFFGGLCPLQLKPVFFLTLGSSRRQCCPFV